MVYDNNEGTEFVDQSGITYGQALKLSKIKLNQTGALAASGWNPAIQKYQFVAFVHKQTTEYLAVDIESIGSPYDLWNGPLPDVSYAVITADPDSNREITIERFRNDPDWVSIDVICGN